VCYINKLENYGEIAKIATDHGLYEEALTIYRKYDQHVMAINVLVEHIVSIDRGFDYASKVNRPEVWSRLAKAQLDGLRTKDSIGTQCFALSLHLELTSLVLQTRTSKLKIRPTLPKSLNSLVMLANMTTLFASFKWLANLSRNRESIQSWCMCMPRPIACMTWRDFLSMTNVVDALEVGEKCFEDGLLPSCQITLHPHLKLGSPCYHAYMLGRESLASRS